MNMNSFPLLAAGFLMSAIAVIFFVCAVILILVILIQKGKGGGLSAAFGGGMASGILGSKTGDFLTWVTIVLAIVFLFLGVLMAKFYKPQISNYDANQPTRQEMPQGSAQTSQGGDSSAATSDKTAEANSIGG